MLLIAYAPHSHACERMKALFAINRTRIMGYKGRLLHKYLAVINRHHFSFDGGLLGYDPSIHNNKQSKLIHELASILKSMSQSKEDYLEYLKKGMALGISSFAKHFARDEHASFTPKPENVMWKITSDFLTTMIGFDISSLHKVEPALVLSHRANRVFMKIMHYCCQKGQRQFIAARELIDQHRAQHKGNLCTAYEIMERYVNQAYDRFIKKKQSIT